MVSFIVDDGHAIDESPVSTCRRLQIIHRSLVVVLQLW
jgi:hypothetical protein